MPVEPKKSTHIRFRNGSDDSVNEKRARGEISCAECRRLKLKCDRKIPCGSCVRRGCTNICPHHSSIPKADPRLSGSLTSGQGPRYIYDGHSGLNKKMSDRINRLEAALAELQSKFSTESHPLLNNYEVSTLPVSDTALEDSSEIINSVGTLTIDDHGEAQYFGRSAGTEPLFLAAAEMIEREEEFHQDYCEIPVDVIKLSKLFPVAANGSWDVSNCLDLLIGYLPEQTRAWSLCEAFYEQASWASSAIKRDELVNEILSPIYKTLAQRQEGNMVAGHSTSPHKLAALCMVFGIGTLVDLTVDSHSSDAEKFYHLSRAALSLQSILQSPEIVTIQSLILLSSKPRQESASSASDSLARAAFISLGGKREGIDSPWTIGSIAAKLSQSIGLHRDCARWNLDHETIQRRRHLFWEIFYTDLLNSLAFGRPSSFNLAHIDCEFPDDIDQIAGEDGSHLMSDGAWRCRFAKDVIAIVTESILAAKPPNYAQILELDHKVRIYAIPPHLSKPFNPNDGKDSLSDYVRGRLLPQIRAIVLLYLHRTYFTQAILDFPGNPLRSPYAPSFLAANQCASWIISTNINHFSYYPELISRFSAIWTHMFTASVILGSTVLKAPTSAMAGSAFVEFNLALDLFEKGSKISQRARNGLVLLRKFQSKMEAVRKSAVPLTEVANHESMISGYGGGTLAMFGGQTRVLISKLSNGRKNRKQSSSTSNSSSPSEVLSGSPVDDVHPSLVEYLSFFPQPYPVLDSAGFPYGGSTVPGLDDMGVPRYDSSSFNRDSVTPTDALRDIPGISVNHGTGGSTYYAPRYTNELPQLVIPNDGDRPMDLETMFSSESEVAEPWASFMHDADFSHF